VMKEPVKEPQKIKIVVKPAGAGVVPARKKEEPTTQPTKRKKGLIRKIVEIVSNDIRDLPDKLWGKKQVKKATMPDSKESWKDWEGEL
jgi:hypothetical protein